MPVLGALSLVTVLFLAIALPNFLNAVQRANQKRTMGDLRSVGTAVEAYAADHGAYPKAPWGRLDAIAPRLSPTYIKDLPMTDGWDSWFLYRSDGKDYELWSTGRDGRLGPNTANGPTTSLEADLVFADGQFERYPEGVCR